MLFALSPRLPLEQSYIRNRDAQTLRVDSLVDNKHYNGENTKVKGPILKLATTMFRRPYASAPISEHLENPLPVAEVESKFDLPGC